MSALLRVSALLCAFSITALAAPPDDKPQPAAPPPASLDVVTFALRTDGENHKLIVTRAPALLRVDAPDDRFSIIYDAQTEHFTGLEQSNDTWWEFSWPEVRKAVEVSKRNAVRLAQRGIDGISSSAPADTNTPALPDDNAGYIWRATTDKKRIAGLDCTRWVGESVSQSAIEAWCVAGAQPKILAAIGQLRAIEEPVELVPVRTLVPDVVFPVYDALVKGGNTPVLIIWGGTGDKNHFSLVETKTRDYQAGLFAVPKLYLKTTLITMDGLIDQKK